jgi:hypothetical protein
MINSFKQYLVEAEQEVFITFGRANPPTIGHQKVFDKLASLAGRSPYKIFLTQTQDKNKNPLLYSEKIKYARKMFPKHARNILINKKIKTILDALTSLNQEGYNRVTVVVGSDRIQEFDVLLNKYNGQKARHGIYNFERINIKSAGERDPDAEGVEGMSASKMRAAASNNDFVSFSQGLPRATSNADAKSLFNSVRIGMGLKEQLDFKNHIELEKVSDVREAYIKGNLFELGDKVRIKKSGQEGVVSWLGTNYLVVDLGEGKTSRLWLEALTVIDTTKDKIEKEKEADKRKHDRMMDKARTQHTTKLNNKESVDEARAKQAVSQGKVQKLVTAHGLKFKGKVYKEIDMELKGIDNNTKEVTFNIIHPKEIFGNEVKLAFNVLRRGPFMATDTSKIFEKDKEQVALKKGMHQANLSLKKFKEYKQPLEGTPQATALAKKITAGET